jgi:phosphate transport system protein
MAVIRHFDDELAQFSAELAMMGSGAARSLGHAIQAVTERNDQLAEQVQRDDDITDQYEKDIDGLAINLLAKAPLATDLRLVTVAMKISQNLERVGDEATTIARRARALNAEPPLESSFAIARMGEMALSMLHEALDAFVNRKPEQARAVIPRDKEVDALNRQLYGELAAFMAAHPAAIGRCLHLITIAKSLERAADHAKNIAQEVVYICEALDLRRLARAQDARQ